MRAPHAAGRWETLIWLYRGVRVRDCSWLINTIPFILQYKQKAANKSSTRQNFFFRHHANRPVSTLIVYFRPLLYYLLGRIRTKVARSADPMLHPPGSPNSNNVNCLGMLRHLR